MSPKVYYPIFLDLSGKRCVIVGGGRVAERKCATLIKTGARITVISPAITKRLAGYREKGWIRHIPRQYRSGDIKSAFIVIAATDSGETNEKVARDVMTAGKLLNVVDVPSQCNFIVPSVLRRGLLTIAISTGGTSPALAKAIRKEMQRLYGREYSRYLDRLRDIRLKVMKEIPDKREREKILKGLAASVKKGKKVQKAHR